MNALLNSDYAIAVCPDVLNIVDAVSFNKWAVTAPKQFLDNMIRDIEEDIKAASNMCISCNAGLIDELTKAKKIILEVRTTRFGE